MHAFVDWLTTISTTLFTYLSTDLADDIVAVYMAYAFSLISVLLLIGFSLSLVPLLFKLVSNLLVRGSK